MRWVCFVTQTMEPDPECLDRNGRCPYGCVILDYPTILDEGQASDGGE